MGKSTRASELCSSHGHLPPVSCFTYSEEDARCVSITEIDNLSSRSNFVEIQAGSVNGDLCTNLGSNMEVQAGFSVRKKQSHARDSGTTSCGGGDKESLNGKHHVGGYVKGVVCPRDRLQRHRLLVAGTVHIPEAWCGEARLREWVASQDVEEALRPPGLFTARAALISAGSTSATSTPPAPPPCEVSLLS
eukprot:c21646_g1_i1 orf=145-717(+)